MKRRAWVNAERHRLQEAADGEAPWRKWGPYLSERQWGTVREDYSPDGNAWDYFPHEMARSRAYRWGEDGLAGFSDDGQRICLALALWNGQDPILKERLFGLTNHEGNHGEDVKELYYYLDATPTHSYLKMLYKYPQREFPYSRLVEENRRRGRNQPEFELPDAGAFEDDRYFDVFVEYAKAAPEDILMLITVHNRGPDDAVLHVLPQIWFRNTWAWKPDAPRPQLHAADGAILLEHPTMGRYTLQADGAPQWLFCENETNVQRLWGRHGDGFFKDAFHEYLADGHAEAVNPAGFGTKAAAHHGLTVPAGATARLRLRLAAGPAAAAFADFEEVMNARRREADEFHADLQRGIDDSEARRVQRQAFAGLIWNKQFYRYDVAEWLDGDPTQPSPHRQRGHGRNWEWRHLNNADVLSMPDKWEYPWYASWDLAFHCIPMALIDAQFAKEQLLLLNRVWYMHPNGQLPAYEWDFSQANPPVHAWAAWRVFQIDRKQRGDQGDLGFLERVFHKLMLNFTWWVNRKDLQGRNVFQGGFLGLDNIGVFDRSASLPMGGHINQADGTSWMAMYCLNLMRIALELALHNRAYEDVATKFFEHFLYIAKAMTNIAESGLGLWDEQDEFYYDVLNLPDGRVVPLRLRSMVGLIPLFAVETIEPEILERLPDFARRLEWFLANRPGMAALVSRWQEPGRGRRHLLSLLRGHRMKCLLRRMLDPAEFLSEYGVRSLSKHYRDHPFELPCNGQTLRVTYEPAESECGVFGGNSNWRGPIWLPVNYLIIESLQKFHHYYGDDFRIECPTGSGRHVTILDVADDLTRRLAGLFLKGEHGRRPCMDGDGKATDRLRSSDHVLFHEFFHGDTGRGLGASHQTGWTALIAKLLQPRRKPR
jgi:hypothetical protein